MQQLQLFLLVHRRISRLCELEEVDAQQRGDMPRAGEIGDDHAVDQLEPRAAFRQRRGHEHHEIGVQRALIVFQLDQPRIVPVAGVLALPKDRAALPAARIDDNLMQVRAANALSNGVDVV